MLHDAFLYLWRAEFLSSPLQGTLSPSPFHSLTPTDTPWVKSPPTTAVLPKPLSKLLLGYCVLPAFLILSHNLCFCFPFSYPVPLLCLTPFLSLGWSTTSQPSTIFSRHTHIAILVPSYSTPIWQNPYIHSSIQATTGYQWKPKTAQTGDMTPAKFSPCL